jgi:hypothetical protein
MAPPESRPESHPELAERLHRHVDRLAGLIGPRHVGRLGALDSAASLGQQFLLGSGLSGVDADGHEFPPQSVLSPADRYPRYPRLLSHGPGDVSRREHNLTTGRHTVPVSAVPIVRPCPGLEAARPVPAPTVSPLSCGRRQSGL